MKITEATNHDKSALLTILEIASQGDDHWYELIADARTRSAVKTLAEIAGDEHLLRQLTIMERDDNERYFQTTSS